METVEFQKWITFNGTDATPLVQDVRDWLDGGLWVDWTFWLDVMAATSGALAFSYEGAPAKDDGLFATLATVPVMDPSSGVVVSRALLNRTLMTPAAQWLRWKITPLGAGPWSTTFRVVGAASRVHGGAFVPTQLAGCQLWLRSDMGVSIVSGGVSSWADQSGNARDASQATGSKRPTLLQSAVNGFPAVSFDGVDDVLASPAFSAGTYTMCLVTTGQIGGNGYFFTRSAAGVEVDTLYGGVGNTTYVNRGGTVSAYDNVANWGQWIPSTAKLLVQTFDGSHAGHIVRVNGLTQSWGTTSGGDPGTGPTTHQLVIAGRNDSYAPSNINVAEAVFFDRVLSDDELATVEQYLRRRYALG